MRTCKKAALSVAGLALVGIGGSVAWLFHAGASTELQRALKGIEDKAQASITESAKDAASLAAVLEIDEASARYIMGRLAADGKVTLTTQART